MAEENSGYLFTDYKFMLNESEIKTKKEKAEVFIYRSGKSINGLSDRQLLSYLGIINYILFLILNRYDCLKENNSEENWRIGIKTEVLHRLDSQPIEVQAAISSMEKYLLKNWEGSYHSTKTLLNMRNCLAEEGLFEFKAVKGARWGKLNGVTGQGTATPPMLCNVDVAGLVIYYKVLYDEYCDRIERQSQFNSTCDSAFGNLPKHNGRFVLDIYDAILDMMNGIYDKLTIELSSEDVSTYLKPVVWKWKRIKGMTRKMWERMVYRDNGRVHSHQTMVVPNFELVPY